MIVRNIMGEMRTVPDYHVCPVNRLAMDPAVKSRFVRRTSGNGAIVDLSTVIPENPQIPASERCIGHGGCHAIVGPRNDIVGFPGRDIFNAPFAFARGISRTSDLEYLLMPVRAADKRWIIKFANAVVPGCPNIEIQPPVRMVMVNVANTGILDGRKAKPRPDRAVQ